MHNEYYLQRLRDDAVRAPRRFRFGISLIIAEYCAKISASDAADNEYVVVEVVVAVHGCGGGMRGDDGGPSGEEITKWTPTMVVFDGEVLDSSSELSVFSKSLPCELSTITIELWLLSLLLLPNLLVQLLNMHFARQSHYIMSFQLNMQALLVAPVNENNC